MLRIGTERGRKAMMEYFECGSAPVNEACVQVSRDRPYFDAMKEECRRYRELLEKKFGTPPDGAYFAIKTFEHDFGPYCEVVLKYDPTDEGHCDFVELVDHHLPLTWDDDQPVQGYTPYSQRKKELLDKLHQQPNWDLVPLVEEEEENPMPDHACCVFCRDPLPLYDDRAQVLKFPDGTRYFICRWDTANFWAIAEKLLTA
jgi:hypothetical protein